MKVYDNADNVLLEVQSLSRNGTHLEFTGIVMGTMPVRGTISPEQARKGFRLIRGAHMWLFLLTFLFRRS